MSSETFRKFRKLSQSAFKNSLPAFLKFFFKSSEFVGSLRKSSEVPFFVVASFLSTRNWTFARNEELLNIKCKSEPWKVCLGCDVQVFYFIVPYVFSQTYQYNLNYLYHFLGC